LFHLDLDANDTPPCASQLSKSGQKSRWYQAAVRQKSGRIIAAGTTKDVSFEPVDGPINDRIDDAYRAKYQSSSPLRPMISARARAATVKVVPRDTRS